MEQNPFEVQRQLLQPPSISFTRQCIASLLYLIAFFYTIPLFFMGFEVIRLILGKETDILRDGIWPVLGGFFISAILALLTWKAAAWIGRGGSKAEKQAK